MNHKYERKVFGLKDFIGTDMNDSKINNNPLISIIVTVYNTEEYLNHCIESIVAQTYKNIEILIIDDGSKDVCRAMCDEWGKKDERIRVFHKENGGISSAKNMGLREAKGDLIAFVDSDDYIVENMYEEMLKALNETGSDIVRCGLDRVDEDEKFLNTVTLPDRVYDSREVLKQLSNGLFLMNQLSLSKRKSFDGVTFPEGRVSEDLAVAHLLYANVDKIAFIEKALYKYRIRNKSIMHAKNNKGTRELDALKGLYNRFLFFKEKGYDDLLLGTCSLALNRLSTITDIDNSVSGNRQIKKEIISLYRQMYRKITGKKPLKLTVCYLMPYAYSYGKKFLK